MSVKMGIAPFARLLTVSILILAICSTADGFRLVQSKKESAADGDKAIVFKDDGHVRAKEKYTNHSIDIRTKHVQKQKKTHDDDEDDNSDEESVISHIKQEMKAKISRDISPKDNSTKKTRDISTSPKVQLKQDVDPEIVKVSRKETSKNETSDDTKKIPVKPSLSVKSDTSKIKPKDDVPIVKEPQRVTEHIPKVKTKEELPRAKETQKPKETPKSTQDAIKVKPKEEPPKIKEPQRAADSVPKVKSKDSAAKQKEETAPKQTKKPEITTKQQVGDKNKSKPTMPDKTAAKKDVKPAKTPTDQRATREMRYNLPSFFPNFGLSTNEECKRQGHLFLDNFKNNKIWALKMFDSSAKIPSGILRGNLNQLGDYDQCLGTAAKVPIDPKKELEIKIAGKYCLASIDVQATTQDMKLPINLAQGRALIRSKIHDPGHFIPRFTTIQWGMCVPAACTAEDTEEMLRNALHLYNGTYFPGAKLDVSVEPEQCFVRKGHKKLLDYELFTLLTIGLLVTSALVAFMATLRDVKVSDEPVESSTAERILMAFSVKRTFKKLFQRQSAGDEIECVHGIRTICTLLLYVGHKLMPLGHSPFTNRVELTEIANHPFSTLLRMSVIYTDSFLLLSGLLISYHMCKDMERKGYIPWVNRIFARFIRLAPSLLVVLLYYAYVMEHLNDGPLWNTVITSNARLCKEGWWKNILFVQNLYPFEEMCATHTHQLALDMQLFLSAPILVWLLYKRPVLGVVVTLLLHVVSVVLRYHTTLNYRLSLVIYHGISIRQLYRTANMVYASTVHRITPYIAGVGLGVLLQQMKSNFHVPKVLLIVGWIVAGYFAGWTLYAPSHLASRSYKYDVNEAAQYAALCSLSWALALSWIIFSSYANNEGYINSFLSSHPMVIFSRLSYNIYLTQFTVFFYKVGILRTSTEFDPIKNFDIIEFGFVIGVSIVLTLFIDLPVQNIKSVLMSSSAPRQTEVQDDDPSECVEEIKEADEIKEDGSAVEFVEDVEDSKDNDEIQDDASSFGDIEDSKEQEENSEEEKSDPES